MSEQVQTTTTQTPANIQYIVYDPAKRRSSRRRGATRYVAGKPVYDGPRGGVAWVGPRKLRYDPALIAYEPRRRRVRRYDPQRAGGKTLVDSMVDGLGFGLLAHTAPIPSGNIAGFTYADVAAGVLTAVYEKAYMRRGWTAAIIGGLTGFATGKIVQTLGGWRT